MQKNCWGDEIVSNALETKGALSIVEVHNILSKAKVLDGLITASFEGKGKGSVTFLTRQYTYIDTR